MVCFADIVLHTAEESCCSEIHFKGKGKGGRTPVGFRQGAHLPDIGRWARRWMDHWVCDAWPVRRQTYGCLPSRRTSLPFGWYQIILLGDRGPWVWTTCPELLLGSGLAGSRTRDLSITSQPANALTTEYCNLVETWKLHVQCNVYVAMLLVGDWSRQWDQVRLLQHNEKHGQWYTSSTAATSHCQLAGKHNSASRGRRRQHTSDCSHPYDDDATSRRRAAVQQQRTSAATFAAVAVNVGDPGSAVQHPATAGVPQHAAAASAADLPVRPRTHPAADAQQPAAAATEPTRTAHETKQCCSTTISSCKYTSAQSQQIYSSCFYSFPVTRTNCILAVHVIKIIVIVIIIIMVLFSWHCHCESSPGFSDECSCRPL